MEQKLSREGHRKRMRKNYITNGLDAMEDHNVLELFLSLIIPQRDVKPLAYELINKFGNLENVFNADIDELMSVNGIGESCAVAINMVNDINTRVNANKNRNITRLNNSNASKEYVKNILSNQKNEKFIMITLDNSLNIIKSHTIAEGVVNTIKIEPKKMVESVIKDNASSIIIAHNHPNGSAKPSAADINFTLETIQLMRKIEVRVNDHIIVGKDSLLSMNNNAQYMIYFDN